MLGQLRRLLADDGLLGRAPPDAIVAVTDGAAAAYVATRGPPGAAYAGEVWRVRAPAVNAVNPIGAGDTVSGVMLCALLEGRSPPQALALGMAAASASCRSLRGADFDLASLAELAAETTVEQLEGKLSPGPAEGQTAAAEDARSQTEVEADLGLGRIVALYYR